MANIPIPRSYAQILGEMANTIKARLGINSLKRGSALLTILEAAAQSDLRATKDVFDALASVSLDNGNGDSLDRTGESEGVPRFQASSAIGQVTISDSTFSKASTRIYQGLAAPNAGTTALNVVDAARFPSTGSIYIGRNTANYEGPIAYSAKAQDASGYWTLTVAATTKFHNTGETVILAQGGLRTIPAGTTVKVPVNDVAPAVAFSTVNQAQILDGEIEVTNVDVVCDETGTVGNVAAYAITEVSGSPFPNAAVANPLPFTTALDIEDDNSYRERIRDAIASRSKATAVAIKTNAIGIVAPDEPKRVLSASVITNADEPSLLVIDDGSGYEEKNVGVAVENVMDEALGGEQYFTLQKRPVAKAFVKSTLTAPFVLVDGSGLAFTVGNETTEHVFNTANFRAIGNATTFEVVSSINSDSDLNFSARTADGGTKLVVFAKADTNEDIELATPTADDDANDSFEFPNGLFESTKLYKNDVLLYKDGLPAQVRTAVQGTWGALATSETVTIAVDGTAAIAYTFTDSDFVDQDTGYVTLAPTNSLASWATVFNAEIAGVTTTVEGDQLVLTSNKGNSADASIVISTGTLVTKEMFTATVGLTSTGKDNDYKLDRNLSQVKLNSALDADDRLTIGTTYTRGYVETPEIASAAITVAGTNANTYWFVVDGATTIIPHGITAADTITVLAIAADGPRVRFTVTAGNFGQIQQGDWIVIWDKNAFVNPDGLGADIYLQGAWRINQVAGDKTWFEIEDVTLYDALVADGGLADTFTPSRSDAYVFARTSAQVQDFDIAASAYTLDGYVTQLNSKLVGATASVFNGTKIRVTTNTFDDNGDIICLTARTYDTNGAPDESTSLPLDSSVSFNLSELKSNYQSHIGFVESGNSELGTTRFSIERPTATTSKNVFNANFSDITPIELNMLDTGRMVVWKRPIFGTASPVNSYGTNTGARSMIQSTPASQAAGATTVRDTNTHIITNYTAADTVDRFYLGYPFFLGYNDSLTLTIDNDQAAKAFTIPTYRNIKPVGNNYSVSFDITDTDNNDVELSSAFGDMSFNDFALFMNARVRSHADAIDEFTALWRYMYQKGPSGNSVYITYSNPTAPDQAIDLIRDDTALDTILQIRLASGNARSGYGEGALNGKAFTVADNGATAGTAGKLFTFEINDAAIDFGAGIQVGDILTLSSGALSTSFTGTYRVTAVTAPAAVPTSFQVEMSSSLAPGNGTVSDTTKIKFYPITSNTLNTIISTINTSYSSIVTGTAIGTGLGTITKSTQDEDYENVTNAEGATSVNRWKMADGINFITTAVDNGGPTATTLTLKNAVNTNLSGANSDFANDTMTLVPWTAKNISDWLNNSATSALNQFGAVTTSSKYEKIQIHTDTPGESGSVEVTGGTANAATATVLGTSALSVNISSPAVTGGIATISAAQAAGFTGGMWVSAQGSIQLPKNNSVDSSSSVEVTVAVGPDINNPFSVRWEDPDFVAVGTRFPVWTLRGVTVSAGSIWRIEKHGKFAALVYDGAAAVSVSNIVEGDMLSLDVGLSNVSAANRGYFRVVRTQGAGASPVAIWYENANAVEETVTLPASSTPSTASILVFTYDSALPGDTLKVTNSVLGANNNGDFTITGLDLTAFQAATARGDTIYVSGTLTAGTWTSAAENYLQIIEKDAHRAIKQIYSVRPAVDTDYSLVSFVSSTDYSKISANNGVILTALDKLAFPTTLSSGVDGYRYSAGLIGETNKVMYGDESNLLTYPGIVAAGAQVNISGPKIRKIEVAMQLRLQNGYTSTAVINNVKSAVASAINNSKVGQPIAISDLVSAATKVSGVVAVSVTSPTYNNANDLIAVQAYEKPMVLNLENDITITVLS